MTKILTDTRIRAIAVDDGKRKEVFDPAEPGLLIRVSKRGPVTNRVWYLRYRLPDGRQPRMKLGTYPATGLDDARTKARAAKKTLEGGADPATVQRKAKAEAKAQTIRTLDDLAEAYWTACEAGAWTPRKKVKRPQTIARERAVYRRYLKRQLGARQLADIRKSDVRGRIREMITAGIGAQTNQAHGLVRQIYAFAIAEELATENPAIGLSGTPKRARERVLTNEELAAIWTTLGAPEGLKRPDGTKVHVGPRVALSLKVAMLLLQRRQEIAGMRIDELDLDAATWTIPAARSKGGRPHLVPLPSAALALINEAIALQDKAPETARKLAKDVTPKPAPKTYVFPAARGSEGSMHPDSLTHAMGGLSDALELKLKASPHDFRRTGATRLGAAGTAPFIVSQVLGHSSDGGGGAAVTRAHYNLHTYAAEKRRALEAWEALLRAIIRASEAPL